MAMVLTIMMMNGGGVILGIDLGGNPGEEEGSRRRRKRSRSRRSKRMVLNKTSRTFTRVLKQKLKHMF